MRRLLILLITTSIGLVPGCLHNGQQHGTYNLLPQPEIMKLYGNSRLYPDSIKFYRLADGVSLPVPPEYVKGMEQTTKISGPQIVFREDKSLALKDQGYMLDITRDQITITGDKKVGRFYGFITLQQLMSDANEQGLPLPMCHIEDYPKLTYRAIHLDMKHHRDKKEYYYEVIDQLARYKINAIIAEVEDKLGYERRPVVASADALSIKEWKKLSEYAKDRYIEISPLIQGLGHASYILKHDQFKYLRDDPASDWAFNPLLPETYEVQFDLYRDALKAMPDGEYLHVGGDEVHTTGRGSGKSELELQLIWLNKVCAFADENGRTPIFWDDMPLKYADLYRPMFDTRFTKKQVDSIWKENEPRLLEYLEQFPKNCIYMRWNYSHPETEGNIRAMEWFTEHEFDVMGATAGQTRWVLMPQNESNMENIRSFAMTSIEMDTKGLLLTLWDDDSPHFELYMRGIIAFAEYAWSGDQRSKDEIKAAYRHREYAIPLAAEEYGFVDQLEEGVAFWNTALLKSDCRNRIREMEDPAEEAVIDLPFFGEKEDWTIDNSQRLQDAGRTIRNCNRIAAIIDTMKLQTKRNLYRLEVYEQVNNLVLFSAQVLFDLQRYAMAQPGKEEEEALATLQLLPLKFSTIRAELEKVYSKTRILSKPEGYILDQDQHHHLANQSINFDWQFGAEMWFLKKLENEINNLNK
jgi:hexosaminidase